MKLKLLPLMLVAACSNGPTKQESVQVFAAASTALASAQARAVTAARASTVAPWSDLTLDFTGACSLGGTLDVDGAYHGDRSDDHAEFDLHTKFTGCREVQGTLDGELQWTSVATGSSFTATMKGGLDWEGKDSSAFCDFDLVLIVNEAGVSYSGKLCGYDVKTEIGLGGLRG